MNPITVTRLDVRVANPPLGVPHATASGMVAAFPVVLLDLRTSADITGSAYAFTYTLLAAPALARLLEDLATVVVGQPCAPLALDALLRQRFRLLGAQGIVAMARAAIDMAAWDVACKAAGLPLYALLGATRRGSRGYAPVGLSGREGSARESRDGVARGFGGVKAKIGYASAAEDIAVLRAMREAVGPGVAIMADYNQTLDMPAALARCAALDADPVTDLAWIEEPTTAEDYAGHAQIKAATRIPIQAGENWWGPLEVRKALDAGAVDMMMPDVMKVGGITSWMKAAAMAEAQGMPISNHLFPEVSAHLMAAAATPGWFEWCDWAEPLLATPVEVREGLVWPSEKAGIGIEWDEKAVARFKIK